MGAGVRQDLEWILLHALGRLGRVDGESSYVRLSTRPIEQELACVPSETDARERRRRAVLAGGYRIRSADSMPQVTIVGMGVVMPQVLAAADELDGAGIAVDVVCLTSADLIHRALQARAGLADGDDSVLSDLFPLDRAAPIVSVLDGHPHTLSFLGSVNTVPISALGVQDFGQSGDVEDLYEYYGIDGETIVGAALDLMP